MTRRRSTFRNGALLALTLASTLLPGCLGRSPEPRIFTLGSEVRPPRTGATSDLAILVGPARFPRFLERPQLVRRRAGGEIELDEFHRWAGSFEENVVRALALDIADRIGSDRVVAHPSSPPFDLDYRIRIHFDELVVGPDDVLRMRARWSVRPEASGEAVLGRTDLDQTTEGGSMTSLVAAHDRAIEALGTALVAEIERLERTAAPPGEGRPE